ncbi:MAG: hypothetical protein NTV51_29770 [Verrucomicrobia bacterium]|nr:hypothetical protein [Verrucomicrobiota bacterium]
MRERADDLELAGGLAREVEGAVEVAGAELAEGEFEEDAGLAEAGGGLEQDEGVAFEGRGEVALRRLLAGTGCLERRAEAQAAQALAGAEAEIEKLGDALELAAEKGVVGGGEGDRLGEAAGGLDEDELRAEGGGGGVGAETPQRGVGGELDEVVGVVAAEFGFVGGERAGDGLDLAEDDQGAGRGVVAGGDGGADELVDAAREVEGPAAMDDGARDGDFELGGGGVGGDGLGPELVVPVGAELGAPEASIAAAAGVMGAEGEGGKLADAQADGAGVEG